MDAYVYAAELGPNQSQLLSNMVVLDNGRAVTRAGADQLDSNPPTFVSHVSPSGQVQGLAFLDNLTNGQLMLMGQGGKLYTWNGSSWSMSLAFSLTSASAQFSAVQGVDKLLITDGVQHMHLWDGVNFTDCGAAADTNAPIGATIVSFIAGMFVAAGPAMVQGGSSTVYPADTLFFSNYLTAGAGDWNVASSFRVGNGDGEAIVAVMPLQTTATAIPVYNLGVLKNNSVWVVSINPGAYTSFSAMFAKFAAAPQGDQVGTGIGCVGKNAYCVFQNDLLFMSQDGVYSLQMMVASAGQFQLNEPLSRPVQPYIDRINWSMGHNIQAIKYRRLAIFWVPLDNSTVNNCGLVWNGRIQQWTVWTGWTPDAMCVTRFNNQIQLVIGNSDGSVNQWKDAQDLFGLDSTYFDNGVSIPWELDTRAYVFGNLDFQKKLRAVLVRFNQGNATVNFSAFLDTADDDDWTEAVQPTSGATLPVILPFVLASSKPVQAYRQLEGLPYCNEFYLKISAIQGWADIRGVVAAAYLKTLRNPNA